MIENRIEQIALILYLVFLLFSFGSHHAGLGLVTIQHQVINHPTAVDMGFPVATASV